MTQLDLVVKTLQVMHLVRSQSIQACGDGRRISNSIVHNMSLTDACFRRQHLLTLYHGEYWQSPCRQHLTSIFQFTFDQLDDFIFNIYCSTFISMALCLHTTGTIFSYFIVTMYMFYSRAQSSVFTYLDQAQINRDSWVDSQQMYSGVF